ncbi:MAG: hypothetical protein GX989_06180 [Firmicutes bacterium]|nr:hypothetical protein [Bacillota bacterium]
MFSRNKKILARKKYISPQNLIFFCTGIMVGFLSLLIIMLVFTLKNQDGINVYLRGETILGFVSQEVERQIQQEYPVYMAELKADIPSLVEKYTQNFISIGKLEIGGYTVDLPAQFIRELEDDLRRDVTFYVLEIFKNLEEQGFVEEFSHNITKNIVSTLLTDLNGQVINIPLTRYHSLPVTVWLH